ncbi:putative T4-like hoc protein [Prochlorococcus phage P-SSM2]|jgi:hypothetical protein|uniref:Uncharacterized protein n=2 Tax=Salacisavirus pssm2 TaxID=2734140 RepID=R9S7Q1_9CAUD|nr:tail protein [Prochlorococcus phage P-SSM2]AAX44676.1 putative T4-like hoc protein [Prochlorococcus phage P-SSM2]ACY76175.1 conserved hypothetical protein [Prochlorococcus phage P-SSM2]AGN12300.1 hypothetical protein PRTG_00147 [Prochlorococcus phage P-SSM5]
MAFNRELSQFGHYIVVDDTTGKIAITSTTTPNIGFGTTNPQFKVDVAGDINFTGDIYRQGEKFTSGVGIGSTTSNPVSAEISNKIGVGFTDINFVGAGMTVTGYGTTIVVDFTNLAVKSDATIPSLTILSSSVNVDSNTSYLTNTVGAGFTVTLPLTKNPGDFIELHDTEVSWGINNLMVATQNNEQFKNFSGVIDSPLACDVDGATVKLVWTNTYWRVFA